MKIGILYQNFWPEEQLKEALPVIAKMGYHGVQLYVTKALSPEQLSGTGRKEVRRLIEKCGLTLAAVCADFGRGFARPEWAEWSLEKVLPCLPLARDLGTTIVTTHFGKAPEDKKSPAYKIMVEVLKQLADRADSLGCTLASETGAEDPAHLAEFLKELNCPALAVNYDPSNLTRRGFDAVRGVADVGQWIVHTHAKDGLKTGEEAALGEGDVNWPAYISALTSVDYDGFLTVERERMKKTPAEEAKHAFDFLTHLLRR